MRKFEQKHSGAPGSWTDERVERLKKLWAEGFSAEQIACQLGGVSRNSVIGKVHRLGLPGRATTSRAKYGWAKPGGIMAPARNHNVGRILLPVPRTRQLAASAPPARLLPPVVHDLPDPVRTGEASQGVLFADLERHMCRFAVNNSPTRDGHLFCGKDRKAGSSFCVDCHARCYNGVSTRRPALPMRRAA
jgi:GcrA cell cycle regulator